jgi:serine/threonine protein kinase
MSFAKGENVGAYRIIEQLGQGGMATVYKAYHPALDRYVAIKALHPAIMEDPSFQARFEREAKVVAKLEHPNIVPVYDFSEHAGQPYLVMKFIEGETLKARLAKGPLKKDEALRIVQAVGSALTYAHEHGYLHRDVKPSNILIAPEGEIYLADFGLARIAEAGASTLSGDMLMGTPQYISPEQAQGVKDLDEGTDIYSLGVVLYELVVGRVPFSADTPFSIIHDHIYTPLPLPRQVNPTVPEAVELVLLKALAKDREDRFASIEDMIEAFCAAVTGGDIGVLESLSKPRTKNHLPSESFAKAATLADMASADDAPQSESLGEKPGVKDSLRKRNRWFWVVTGLVMTCCILFVFLGSINQLSSRGKATETKGPEDRPTQEVQPEDFSNENAGDVLRRAETLLAEGDDRGAYDAFIKAGDFFMEAGDFPMAMETYLRARELSQNPMRPEVLLANKLFQALFFGAPEEPMWPLIEDLYDNYPDRDVIQVAAARMRLYADSPQAAMAELAPVLDRNPDNAVANVVLVEIHIHLGEMDVARGLLTGLLENNRTPVWLQEHMQFLKRQIPE